MSEVPTTAQPRRDTDAVLTGFIAWLGAHRPNGTPELIAYEHPPVGFSSETILVEVAGTARHQADRERLVLKLPPLGAGIFPTYDFALQARVQQTVAASAIPAAVPAQVEDDPAWVGAPFLVMPAVEGHIVGEIPIRDHWLTDVDPTLNTTVYEHYIDTIAAINHLDWRSLDVADVVPVRDNAAEIAYWRRYLAWYADGAELVPALLDALDWCDAHRPKSEPEPSLLWGDVRLGNVIFRDDRTPAAVLDWEMATIGPGEHDLAWTLTLEAIQDELFGRRVPGFLSHDEAVARYEGGLGRAVQDLEWYEILAFVRSTAVMTRVAHLNALAGRPEFFPIADNPILGILARRIRQAETTGSCS